MSTIDRTPQISKSYPTGVRTYPIGVIQDKIEIHFLHYASEEEAEAKWNRRAARMRNAMRNGVPIFAKLCDKGGGTAAHFSRFHALPFPGKLSISVNPFNSEHHVWVPRLRDGTVNEVVHATRLYRKRYKYMDISQWIATGKVGHSWFSRLIYPFA